MNRLIKTLGMVFRAIRLVIAIFCLLIALTGILVELSDGFSSNAGAAWMLIIFFLAFAILLLRSHYKDAKRKKENAVHVAKPNTVRPAAAEEEKPAQPSEKKRNAFYKKANEKEQLTAPCYVVFDVETTGLNHNSDKIIEIAALKVEDSVIVDRFETLIHPGCEIPSRITKITGIKTEDVQDAPHMTQIAPQLVSFIGDVPIVAHNAVFDVNFLISALRAEGVYAKIRYIDTLDLARQAFPGLENYKLNTLISELGISHNPQKHRAMSDVEQTLQLYQMCRDRLSNSPAQTEKEDNESEFDRGYALNQLGMDYESSGAIEDAIRYYEAAVAENFSGTYPYQRLAVLYRRKKQYSDEIRICDCAINMFQGHANREKMVSDFQHRKSVAEQKESLQTV